MKFAIIASTGGSVVGRLLDVEYFKTRLEYVLSDRDCGAIDVAKSAGIKAEVLKSSSGSEFSDKLAEYINFEKVDLVISFYTKLFKGRFIKLAKGKLINLHPSILPACPGLDGFGDTVKSGSRFVGTTIHFVDEGMDTGKPIIQSSIPYDPQESLKDVRHQIFLHQCKTLLQVIKWFEENRINLKKNYVEIKKTNYEQGVFSPSLDFEEAIKFGEADNLININNNQISEKQVANNILDLRKGTNHPLSFKYSEIFSCSLLDGKFEHGRSQPGFNLAVNSPFVSAARVALDSGVNNINTLGNMVSALSNYYSLVQPQNAAEWLGLPKSSHIRLQSSPPWASVFPWRARTLESYRQAYEGAALAENESVGEHSGIETGWLFCGPVSEKKCEVEAKRILYVVKQILENGYLRSDGTDGDVKATALVNESGEWRWLITAGNHRAAAASAIGYKAIPIRVNLVIERSHVNYWPRVVDGLYTKEEALKIFDGYFLGHPSPIVSNWRTTC